MCVYLGFVLHVSTSVCVRPSGGVKYVHQGLGFFLFVSKQDTVAFGQAADRVRLVPGIPEIVPPSVQNTGPSCFFVPGLSDDVKEVIRFHVPRANAGVSLF